MSRLIPLVAAMLAVQTPVTVAEPTTLALGGAWKFQLDSKGAGLAGKWFSRSLEDSVQLPGTTDENKKGILLDERPADRLVRVWWTSFCRSERVFGT